MIPVWVMFAAFLAVALLRWSKTYAILASFFLVNAIVDPFLHEDMKWLYAFYSTMAFIMFFMVVKYGDISKGYVCSILSCVCGIYFVSEWAIVFDVEEVYESYFLEAAINLVVILLLIGGGNGLAIFNRLSRPYRDRNTVDRSHNNGSKILRAMEESQAS